MKYESVAVKTELPELARRLISSRLDGYQKTVEKIR